MFEIITKNGFVASLLTGTFLYACSTMTPQGKEVHSTQGAAHSGQRAAVSRQIDWNALVSESDSPASSASLVRVKDSPGERDVGFADMNQEFLARCLRPLFHRCLYLTCRAFSGSRVGSRQC